jgi:NADPH:quinone reductase-like Zn-dependent oxidoreductase
VLSRVRKSVGEVNSKPLKATLDTIWTMIFHGKNVVVTGGANGIGLAISRNIAAAGGSVWIFDLESESPAEAAQSMGV